MTIPTTHVLPTAAVRGTGNSRQVLVTDVMSQRSLIGDIVTVTDTVADDGSTSWWVTTEGGYCVHGALVNEPVEVGDRVVAVAAYNVAAAPGQPGVVERINSGNIQVTFDEPIPNDQGSRRNSWSVNRWVQAQPNTQPTTQPDRFAVGDRVRITNSEGYSGQGVGVGSTGTIESVLIGGLRYRVGLEPGSANRALSYDRASLERIDATTTTGRLTPEQIARIEPLTPTQIDLLVVGERSGHTDGTEVLFLDDNGTSIAGHAAGDTGFTYRAYGTHREGEQVRAWTTASSSHGLHRAALINPGVSYDRRVIALDLGNIEGVYVSGPTGAIRIRLDDGTERVTHRYVRVSPVTAPTTDRPWQVGDHVRITVHRNNRSLEGERGYINFINNGDGHLGVHVSTTRRPGERIGYHNIDGLELLTPAPATPDEPRVWQVGDRVRITAHSGSRQYVGVEGTISETGHSRGGLGLSIRRDVDQPGYLGLRHVVDRASAVELIEPVTATPREFQVGDRVRITEHLDRDFIGLVGTIDSVFPGAGVGDQWLITIDTTLSPEPVRYLTTAANARAIELADAPAQVVERIDPASLPDTGWTEGPWRVTDVRAGGRQDVEVGQVFSHARRYQGDPRQWVMSNGDDVSQYGARGIEQVIDGPQAAAPEVPQVTVEAVRQRMVTMKAHHGMAEMIDQVFAIIQHGGLRRHVTGGVTRFTDLTVSPAVEEASFRNVSDADNFYANRVVTEVPFATIQSAIDWGRAEFSWCGDAQRAIEPLRPAPVAPPVNATWRTAVLTASGHAPTRRVDVTVTAQDRESALVRVLVEESTGDLVMQVDGSVVHRQQMRTLQPF